jgi:hypothetical protein
MMVATMTLEIAAAEFVAASATRFAYRRLGPATVTRLTAAVALRSAARGEGAIVNISSIFRQSRSSRSASMREGITDEIC